MDKTIGKRHVDYYCMGKENPCGRCEYYQEGENPFYGWCQHPDNKLPPSSVFPNGVMPSKYMSFTCEKFKEDESQPDEIVSKEQS